MLTYQKIIDISLPLNENTPLYPGNPKNEFEHFASASGNSFNSKISISSHNGTHIDAPRHAFANGRGIDQIDLQHFIGECRVLDLTSTKKEITVEDLQSKNIQPKERILFKTSNSLRGFKTFFEDYIYLSSDGAIYLAKLNILLVGIDALSIKQKGSKDNTPHTALLEKNIPILEGINLKDVDEGEYFLITQPLNLTGLDASPARALLLQ